MTLRDGLTKQEAQSFLRKTLAEEAKLKTFGSLGNYAKVQIEESYRRGHTLDSRDDVIRYKVTAECREVSA